MSNEIAYRVIRQIQDQDQAIRAGHIHTPVMQGYDQGLVKKITKQCAGLAAAAIQAPLY